MCSPHLLKGANPLKEPRDLKHHTLIHIEWDAQWATWPNWAMWLRAAGAPEVDATRGLHFSQTALALQAALDGQGVALGDSTLVADDLAAGRLVRPFSMALKGPAQFAYHLVHAPRRAEEPLIKAFRRWILDEVARTTCRTAIVAGAARATEAGAGPAGRAAPDPELWRKAASSSRSHSAAGSLGSAPQCTRYWRPLMMLLLAARSMKSSAVWMSSR